MTLVDPVFYFRNECSHVESSLVLKFSYKPSVGFIEIVLDYQGGAGEKRDFRQWKFNGVQAMTCNGKPWEGTEDEWHVCIGERRRHLASLYSLSISQVRAVSGAIVAHKLELELDIPVSPVIFNFTSMSVEQRFGVAIPKPGGKAWTYRDANTGKQLDFYQPFPDAE